MVFVGEHLVQVQQLLKCGVLVVVALECVVAVAALQVTRRLILQEQLVLHKTVKFAEV